MYLTVKRIFDLFTGCLLLLLFLPVALVIAAVIKSSSPREPVLFCQTRVGRDGALFTLLKFRTMSSINNPALGVTSDNDPRITSIGRFLRRFKIDELPQLINVVKGDMSLVGPRPELYEYVSSHSAPDRNEVLRMRPGITGPTQLRWIDEEQLLSRQSEPEEYYRDTLLPQKLQCDLEYVRSQNLIYDLSLLCRTIIVLFTRSVHPPRKNGTKNH